MEQTKPESDIYPVEALREGDADSAEFLVLPSILLDCVLIVHAQLKFSRSFNTDRTYCYRFRECPDKQRSQLEGKGHGDKVRIVRNVYISTPPYNPTRLRYIKQVDQLELSLLS